MSAAAFADSSALVKLYADEPRAEAVRGVDSFVVSQLARVEVPAALWRKHRTGELSVSDAAVLVAAFEADYFGTDGEEPRFAVVAADARVLETAARLVGTHGLRAYHGVHLASACLAREAVGEPVVFLAYDEALCAAAAAEGLRLAGAV